MVRALLRCCWFGPDGVWWDKLAEGGTGGAIITSDTPNWVDTLIYHSPGRRVMRNQVTKLTGIKPRCVMQMGSVKMANPGKTQSWLNKAENIGLRRRNLSPKATGRLHRGA